MNAIAFKRTQNESWDYDAIRQEDSEEIPCLRIGRPIASRMNGVNKYHISSSNATICNLGDVWATSQKKWNFYGGEHVITLRCDDINLSSAFKDLSDFDSPSEQQPESSPANILIHYLMKALPKATSQTDKLEKDFNQLADIWYRETRRLSIADQIVLHPAYQQIIGMGKDVLPLIFRELKRTRAHWLWALAMILRDDKAKPGMKYREAVDAWLVWGENNGYI